MAKFFIEAGYPAESVHVSGPLGLPGYYRASKQWDVVVAIDGVLVAAFEMKALGGPSYGNNANNRLEEALGSAVDVQRAALANLYPRESPWLGYLFVIEDAPKTRKPVKTEKMLLPVDDVWVGRSYQERFALTLQRLGEERMYDTVCYLVSSPSQPDPEEPVEALNWAHFSAAIKARIAYLKELGYPKH